MTSKERLIEEMKGATAFIEDAARDWQIEFPAAPPACFLMSSAKFVSDSFASVSDEAFEALLHQMRDERREHQRRKQGVL